MDVLVGVRGGRQRIGVANSAEGEASPFPSMAFADARYFKSRLAYARERCKKALHIWEAIAKSANVSTVLPLGLNAETTGL